MRFALLLAAVALAACSRPATSTPAAPERTAAAVTESTNTDIQTIDNADTRPAVMEPPPTLTDEGGNAPKATVGIIQSDAPPPPLPADERLRANLPFAPAIGLDPVDGSKISIRAATPTCEYKGKTFYFNSEENKRTFLSKPDGYLKGVFASH
jgi:YHS domain-containing protein